LAGNFELDLRNSRNRRLYDSNDAEVRSSQSTAPLLLQTYLRDTGEILNDLSMPIYVNGKHWGGVAAGFSI
jgi:methyl-accepting chemotaxis protein